MHGLAPAFIDRINTILLLTCSAGGNDYCNQISNQGVHYLDLMRWMLNEEAPIAIILLAVSMQ